MSALGDYIHLNVSHYLKKQVRKSNPSWNNYNIASSDYIAVNPETFLSQRSQKIQSVTPAEIVELNQRLGGENYQNVRNDEVKIREDRQDLINELYKDLAKITSVESLIAFQKNSRKVFRLNNLVETDYKWLQKDLQYQADLLREFKQFLNQAISWKQKQLSKEEFNSLLHTARTLDIPVKGLRFSKDRSRMKTTLGKIYQAAQEIQFITASKHLSGQFGEELFYRLAKTADDKAQTQVNETFQKIVGRDRSPILIDKKLIAVDLKESNSLSVDEGGNNYSLGSTQDKVDVQIIVNDNAKIFASIKTINSLYAKKPGIMQGALHLQNVNLLPSLTYLNSTISDFGNHWLNMHTALGQVSLQDNADTILQKEIAYEALVSGNPFKQNASEANVFVYFDRKAGVFKVQRSIDILRSSNKIIQLFNIAELNLNTVNVQSNTTEDRIRKILTKIHGIQIQVVYNGLSS